MYSKNDEIPIYLVSLNQDIVRREKLKKSFPKSYDSFQHIEAVDGRMLSAKEYFDKTRGFFNRYKRIMSPSELGCTLSHIKALHSFLATDAEQALIIEDDIIGDDEDLHEINRISKKMPKNSLLLCGGQQGLNHRYQLIKESNVDGIYDVSKFSFRFVYRTCSYIVTRKSAQQILEYHLNKFITLADKWDVFFKNSEVVIQYINILEHPKDLSNSHIEADRISADKTFIMKVFSIDAPVRVCRKLYFNLMACILKVLGFKEI